MPWSNTAVTSATTKPKDTPAQAALRAKVEAAIKPHQQAQQTDAAGQKHALPESLQKFTTLAEEPAIIKAVEPLRALEAAVARDPDSKEALAALEAALKKLFEVMSAKIEERADKADLEALLTECEAAIATGNHDFEKVYRAVWAVLQSGEEHLWKRFKVAVGALLECIKRPDDKPSQRKEAKQPTTLLADAAHTKPSFEVVVEGLATLGDGTRLEMQRVGDVDKDGDETSGLKKLQRVVEKALLKPASDATVGETDSVLDVVRAMIVVKDFGVIAAIVAGLKALSDAELVEVLRLKNRFETVVIEQPPTHLAKAYRAPDQKLNFLDFGVGYRKEWWLWTRGHVGTVEPTGRAARAVPPPHRIPHRDADERERLRSVTPPQMAEAVADAINLEDTVSGTTQPIYGAAQ